MLSRVQNPKKTGTGWICRCPAHDDGKASLSVSMGSDGRVLLKCHAGCDAESIVRAAGLELRDLFPRKDGASIVAVYDYVDAAGTMRFQTVRFAPKDFRQRRPDSKGGWAWNLKGVLLVLYRLPSVIEAAKAGRTVLVTEGEKDADNLAVMGFVATTSPMGAGKWRDSYSESLAGAPVVIIADKDEPGRKHAEQVAKSVFSVAKSVRIIELPGDGIKDASDWIRAGGTKEQLQAIAKAAPVWTPGESVVSIKAAKEAREEQASIEVEPEPANDWPEPLPFGMGTAPEIRASLIPEPIASFVAALAVALQVPQSACMIAALCTVAATMAKRAVVQIGPDWSEPLNIYGAMVLPPGERKSAILSTCRAPLDEWEASAVRRFGERFAALSAEKRILEARARAAEKRASAKNDPALRDEAIRMAQEAALFRVAATPQCFVDDITTERIVGVMQEQGGKIALFSDEGGIFDIMGGLYASGALKIDAYLKAYDGKAIRVDRVGRASEIVHEPALTMCLAVQPAIIRSLGQNTAMRGRGLLGRVIFVLPDSMLGKRLINPPAMPSDIKADYRRIILFLSDMEDPTPGEQRIIRLSPDALALFNAFRQELEPMLAPDADLGAITDWAGKLAGSIARIAALWHSVEAAAAHSQPWQSSISGETMHKSIALGRLLQDHAKAAFGLMQADGVRSAATVILEWIARKGIQSFTKRDAYRALARHITRADEIEAPIGLLTERGYLRPVSVNGGNRVSTRALTAYEPHPSVITRNVNAGNGVPYTLEINSTREKICKNDCTRGSVDTSLDARVTLDSMRPERVNNAPDWALTALTDQKDPRSETTRTPIPSGSELFLDREPGEDDELPSAHWQDREGWQ